MIRVSQDGDRVVLDLGGRKRSFALPCDDALRFTEALDLHAAAADREPAGLIRGERWSVHVESNRGRVGFRFLAPGVGDPEVVRMPAYAARQLAERVRGQEAMAEFNVLLKVG